MNIIELFKEYANLPTLEAKIEEGKKHYLAFVAALKKEGYADADITNFACMLVRLASGADREADEEEYQLFEGITGIEMSFGEFYGMVKKGHDGEFLDVMDELVDGLNAEGKEEALRFVAVFLSSDHELTAVEKSVFDRLLK